MLVSQSIAHVNVLLSNGRVYRFVKEAGLDVCGTYMELKLSHNSAFSFLVRCITSKCAEPATPMDRDVTLVQSPGH